MFEDGIGNLFRVDGLVHVVHGHVLNTSTDTNIDDSHLDLGGNDGSGFETRAAKTVDSQHISGIGETGKITAHSSLEKTSTNLKNVSDNDIFNKLGFELGALEEFLKDRLEHEFRSSIFHETSVGFGEGGSDSGAENDIIGQLGGGGNFVDSNLVTD